MIESPKHLPYEINEQDDRFHFYETYWKHLGMELLERHYAGRPAHPTLLDYGCGRGETLRIASDLGYECLGTDLDPKCLELSGKIAKVEPLQVNDPLGQFGENSFDVVTCFHVMEHVDSPKAVLGALSRIARDYVVVAVPNLQTLRYLFKHRDMMNEVNEGHLQSWNHGHLRGLAERHCNLDLVEWGHDATVLPFVSNVVNNLCGTKSAIALETKVANRIFPFFSHSVLGLFKVKKPVETGPSAIHN